MRHGTADGKVVGQISSTLNLKGKGSRLSVEGSHVRVLLTDATDLCFSAQTKNRNSEGCWSARFLVPYRKRCQTLKLEKSLMRDSQYTYTVATYFLKHRVRIRIQRGVEVGKALIKLIHF